VTGGGKCIPDFFSEGYLLLVRVCVRNEDCCETFGEYCQGGREGGSLREGGRQGGSLYEERGLLRDVRSEVNACTGVRDLWERNVGKKRLLRGGGGLSS
jgi:hypothetical protein